MGEISNVETAATSRALVPVVNGEIIPAEPALSRRRVLSGMALSVPLAAGAVVLLPSDASAEPVPADPELLRLFDELREADARYRAAFGARKAAWQEWSPQWPVPPADISQFTRSPGESIARRFGPWPRVTPRIRRGGGRMADDLRARPPLTKEKAAMLREILSEPPEVQAIFIALGKAVLAARERGEHKRG